MSRFKEAQSVIRDMKFIVLCLSENPDPEIVVEVQRIIGNFGRRRKPLMFLTGSRFGEMARKNRIAMNNEHVCSLKLLDFEGGLDFALVHKIKALATKAGGVVFLVDNVVAEAIFRKVADSVDSEVNIHQRTADGITEMSPVWV